MKKLLCGSIFMLFMALVGYTNNIKVSNGNDSGTGSLREAITNASNGDTIFFEISKINLSSGEIKISNKSIVIDGSDLGDVTIDGGSNGRIFNITGYFGDSVIIKHLSFTNGYVSGSNAMGGAIYAFMGNGKIQLENCNFVENKVEGTYAQGGAVRLDGESKFINCRFNKNSAIGTNTTGGAINAIADGADIQFINCLIANNEAAMGGGVYTYNGGVYINATITQNSCNFAGKGAGVFAENGGSFTNCLIYNNNSNGTVDNFQKAGTGCAINYTALETGNTHLTLGSNNIELDETPFNLGNNGDSLALKRNSECIDKGTLENIYLTESDIDGGPRVINQLIDLGAYEFSSTTITFMVSDTLESIPFAQIIFESDTLTTDSIGVIDVVGSYTGKQIPVKVQKDDYVTYYDTISIKGDTTIIIELEKYLIVASEKTYASPYELPYSRNEYNYSQMLYLNRELKNINKTISTIGYFWNGYKDSQDTVIIYMTSISDSVLNDWIPINNFVKVYEGVIKNITGDWSSLKLDLPFTLSDTKNLVIAIKQKQTYRSWGSSYEEFYCHKTYNAIRSLIAVHQDNPINEHNPPPPVKLDYRPNIRFDMDLTPQVSNITLTVNEYNFGGIEVNLADSFLFKIYNSGNTAIEIDSITAQGIFSLNNLNWQTLTMGEFSNPIYVNCYDSEEGLNTGKVFVYAGESVFPSDSILVSANLYQPIFSGTGSIYDPYQIKDLDDLKYLSENTSLWDNHFVLMNDIDASETKNWNNGKGLSPIGDVVLSGSRQQVPFDGSFDGGGHLISNVYIDRRNESNVGLFGYVKGDSTFIRNLAIENAYIIGNENVGILAGNTYKLAVENCYTTGKVVGKEANAGGLLGITYSVTIKESYSSAAVSGNSNIGGLIGKSTSDTRIIDCYTTGSVLSNKNSGPIIGVGDAAYSNVYFNKDTYRANENTSIIALQAIEMMFADNFDFWDFSGNWQIENGLSKPYLKNQRAVVDAYNVGFIAEDTLEYKIRISNIHSEHELSYLAFVNANFADSTSNDTLYCALNLKANTDTIIAFTVGNITLGTTYYFSCFGKYTDSITIAGNSVIFETPFSNKGDGSMENPYHIYTLSDLKKLSDHENFYDKHFILMNDIDASATRNWDNGKGFRPIGYHDRESQRIIVFKGSINGNSHVIRNLYINRPEEYGVGLIGHAFYDITVKNLGMENIYYSGYLAIGGIIGNTDMWSERNNWGDTIRVLNSYTTGIIKCNVQQTGGIIGRADDALVQNCYSKVVIQPDATPYDYYASGGLVAANSFSKLLKGYYSGYMDSVDSYFGVYGSNFGYNAVAEDLYYDSQNFKHLGANGTPLSFEQSLKASNYNGFNFNTDWTIQNSKTRPYFSWQKAIVANSAVVDSCVLSTMHIYNNSDLPIVEYGFRVIKPSNTDSIFTKVFTHKNKFLLKDSFIKHDSVLIYGLENDSSYYGMAYAIDADSNIYLGDGVQFIYKNPKVTINNVAIVDASSCGNNDGQLTINADSYTGSLKYSKDGNAWQTSNVFQNLTIGVYSMLVSNGFDTVSYTAYIKAPESPEITSLIQDTTLKINDIYQIEITASGTNLTYQWFKDNIEIANQTSSQLTIQANQFAAAGAYKVKVLSGTCQVESNTAKIEVIAPVDSVKMKAENVLYALQAGQATATVYPDSASNTEYYFYSSNIDVLQVNSKSGQMAAAKSGQSYLYAVSEDNNSIKDSILVEVKKIPSYIVQSPQNLNFTFGQRLMELEFHNSYVFDTVNNIEIEGEFKPVYASYIPQSVIDNSVELIFIPSDTLKYETILDTIVIDISQKIPEVYIWPTVDTVNYGLALNEIMLNGGETIVQGKFEFQDSLHIPKVNESGNLFQVNFYPLDSINYSLVSNNIEVYIKKQEVQISVLPVPDTIIYENSLKTVVLLNDAENSPGKFAFADSLAIPEVKDSGKKWKINFIHVDSANYEGYTDSIQVFVKKAIPAIIENPTIEAIIYGQQLNEAQFLDGATSVSGVFSFVDSLYIPTVSESGNTFEVLFTPNDTLNYNEVSLNLAVEITKNTPVITQWPTVNTIVYGTALKDAVLTEGVADIEGVFSFVDSLYIPEVEESGNIFEVLFIPADSQNYKSIIESIVVHVQKGLPIINFLPVADSLVYGNTLTSLSLNNDVLNSEGKFLFIDSLAIPTVAESGKKWEISFIHADSANYEGYTDSIQVFVKKAIPEIISIPIAAPIIYGEQLKDVQLQNAEVSIPGSFTFVDSLYFPSVTDSGKDFEVLFIPSDSLNYERVNLQLTIEVNKKNPIISEWPVTGTIVYGESLSSVSLTGGVSDIEGMFSFSNSLYIPDASETGSYFELMFTPNDSINYNILKQDHLVFVEKVLLTVQAINDTVFLGYNLPDLEYVVSGFVNNDQLTDIDVKPSIWVENYESLTIGEHIDAIKVGNAFDNNYNFTYVSANLVILEPNSVKNKDFVDVNVYPNPAVDHLKVETVNWIGDIHLINQNNQIVYQSDFNLSKKIGVNELKAGIYILVIQTDTQTFRKAVVIE